MASGDAGGFGVSYSDLQKLIAILQDHHDRLADTLRKVRDKLVTRRQATTPRASGGRTRPSRPSNSIWPGTRRV